MQKFLASVVLFLTLTTGIIPATVDPLEQWYRAYNQALFNHELPDVVIIDHTLVDDDLMAVTEYAPNSAYFRIKFNRKYEPSRKQALQTLLHEQCHISLIVEQEYELDKHGPKWQSCMRKLANKGAFDDLW